MDRNQMARLFLRTVLLAFEIVLMQNAFSQQIKGNVLDRSGNPVPFATIFVKELNKGLAANEKGNFQIAITPGTYTVKFQSIGYKPYSQTVVVGKSDINLNVRLDEAVYDLAQITVSSKDNPGVWIIRKAIALGQQYKRSVTRYGADVYLKGSFNARKFSRILRYMTPRSISVPKAGKTYYAEMLNKITFRAPDAYTQKIVSFRSTLPGADSKDNFPGLEFLSTSIYDRSFGDIPSPLGLSAFTYYNYKLIGSSLQNNVPIYKIQVTPKRPSGKFFKGFLYIADNTYAVKNADLTFEMSFGMAHFKLAFDLIDESAVLPSSYQLNADGALLGSSGWVKSSGSIRYSDVYVYGRPVRNAKQQIVKAPEPEKPAAPAQKTKAQKKREEKIENLMEKTALTKGDMNKLAKLVKEEENEKTNDSLKTLEVRGIEKVDFSDDFNKKDTNYWSEVRLIPMEDEERLAYTQKDSVKTLKDRVSALENFSRTYKGGSYISWVTGGHLYNKNGWEIKTRGFFNPNFTYFNPVDGFTLGNRMAFFKTYDDSREWNTYFIPRYSFNRTHLMGNLRSNYLFSPKHMGSVSIGLNYGSEDFNTDQPVQLLPNSGSSLLFKDNFARDIDAQGGSLQVGHELANGLLLSGAIKYQKRELRQNITNYSFFKQNCDYDPNIPANVYLQDHPLANHEQTTVDISLKYTPKQYYKYIGQRKKYLDSEYPTFELLYRKGILSSSASNFSMVKLSSSKRWDLGLLSEFWYSLEGGKFFDSKDMQLSDFYFPKVDRIPVSFTSTKQSFHLIPYYKYATPDWFVEGHMLYEADFLVKQLPIFEGTVFTENLYLSYFNSKAFKNYVEVGYGIDKIFVMMEIKAIVGFEDGKYRSWGISVSFNRD